MDFLVLGFLHGVRGEFPYDVSGTAVGHIFTGHESEHVLTQWLPKRRWEISSCTPCKKKTQNQKINIHSTVKV
jgi:hypothetical protein